mmetsp:Transcript_138765/g.312378  ORF Transcript_138765/g.312378 Transcript_138765/m.312378 type:complete len:430 (+) Transcript_138765:22-1311(+)
MADPYAVLTLTMAREVADREVVDRGVADRREEPADAPAAVLPRPAAPLDTSAPARPRRPGRGAPARTPAQVQAWAQEAVQPVVTGLITCTARSLQSDVPRFMCWHLLENYPLSLEESVVKRIYTPGEGHDSGDWKPAPAVHEAPQLGGSLTRGLDLSVHAKTYLNKRVLPVLEPILGQVVVAQPEDVPRFILNCLLQQYDVAGGQALIAGLAGLYRTSEAEYVEVVGQQVHFTDGASFPLLMADGRVVMNGWVMTPESGGKLVWRTATQEVTWTPVPWRQVPWHQALRLGAPLSALRGILENIDPESLGAWLFEDLSDSQAAIARHALTSRVPAKQLAAWEQQYGDAGNSLRVGNSVASIIALDWGDGDRVEVGDVGVVVGRSDAPFHVRVRFPGMSQPFNIRAASLERDLSKVPELKRRGTAALHRGS